MRRVYALNTIYEQAKVKPWLLFTCDEEIGGIGAEMFANDYHFGYLPRELDDVKMLIEIDRKGEDDAVYYSCANREFENYVTSKGFTTSFGSFSDISVIAPDMGVAAVNLSSGYYNAHTLYEYIDRHQLDTTIKKVLSMVADATEQDFPCYEYVRGSGGWRAYDGYGASLDVYTADDLSDVPDDIRDEYEALLDYYSPEELDDIRLEFGDKWIKDLYKSEFGFDGDDAEPTNDTWK